MTAADSLLEPARALTVMPFWFWNDALDEAEILRQIADFEAHGVHGFVIHPRVGLPPELAWNSARLLGFYRIAIDEARRRGMLVVLYDEGMYPSGSSAGQVVADNPAFACRGLAMRVETDGALAELLPGENVVARVRRANGVQITVVDRPVQSHIRGLHYEGEGPVETCAAAADILNPDAVASFIKHVHETFYKHFAADFGKTITSIFTDEPSPLGKCKDRGVFPGTSGILPHISKILGYEFTPHLPALWFDDEPDAQQHRAAYLHAIEVRLQSTFWKPVSQWCSRHGIALTGHPRRPDDLQSLRYLHVPGQDLVWRRVLPDHPSALEGAESTQAKCTSSAMAHGRRRRNSNECYGAYGHELNWDEMLWLAMWAFVRGVNLLYPHAFFYSIRGPRQDERPPDVGPHANWWPRYHLYATACRRLAWINTDAVHVCDLAILGQSNVMPWRAAKACFQSQRDFNYVDESDLLARATIDSECICIGNARYRALILEHEPPAAVLAALRSFSHRLVRHGAADSAAGLEAALHRLIGADIQIAPRCESLRVRESVKGCARYLLLFNEEHAAVQFRVGGPCEAHHNIDRFSFDPFSGRTALCLRDESIRLAGHEARLLISGQTTWFPAVFHRQVRWLSGLSLDADEKLLLFSACDSAYLDYALSLIRSSHVFSPGFRFLLHIVNPAARDIAHIQDVVASMPPGRLAVSMETIDLSAFSPEQRRTYFACARFLRLAELLPLIQVPVLCLDADSLIVSPIDLDFSDKAQAELCLVRRDQQGDVDPNLAVMCGSIWLKPGVGIQKLVGAVASDLVAAFSKGTAAWYLDQLVLGRHVTKNAPGVGIFNIKAKYADWDFGDKSIVWAGKGKRKYANLRFSLLQKMLSTQSGTQRDAWHAARLVFAPDAAETEWLRRKFLAAKSLHSLRAALFVPRLDLPWKQPANQAAPVPQISEDTLGLRLHWKEFAIRLANALQHVGIEVDVIELPAWQLNGARVDAAGADMALVPHRCKLDFAPGTTPVMFYMQEFYRWLFVVDSEGWGAAASAYPMALQDFPERTAGAFDAYRQRLASGQLNSKFAQPQRVEREALLRSGQIPDAPYIFVPLQVPHDQSIRYFSDLGQREVLEALIAWCARNGVALVLKPHPANPKSMQEFKAMADAARVHWADAHVQDLIAHASAVYTINSGVGFEALLQLKPVVTFGHTEYDCVTFRAKLSDLDAAWSHAKTCPSEDLTSRYRRFLDWFLGDYAIDMSTPQRAREQLHRLALDMACAMRRARQQTTATPTA